MKSAFHVDSSQVRRASRGWSLAALAAAILIPSCQLELGTPGAAVEADLTFSEPELPAPVGRTNVVVDVDAAGALQARVAIVAPEGRLGATPHPMLSYRSGNSDGSLGVGWSLAGFSRLSRCAPTAAFGEERRDLRFDSSDPLCLDGRRLVLVSGTHGEVDADYRIEGGLERARILSGSFGSPNMLVEVIQPDASRIFFGGGAEWAVSAHRYVQGEAGAQVLEETESTLSWLLRRTRDATGNTVDYRYERSTPRDTSSPAAEVLPVRIEYPGFQPLPRDLSGGFTAGARRIELRYAQYRDRASIQYVSGFPLLSERLLTAIDTSGPLDNTRRWTLRHYDLEYETSALTGRPRLASLRECDGHFDPLTPTSSLGCLRPTYFEYSDGDISFTEAPALGMPLPPGWGGLDEGYDQGFWSYAPSYVVPIDLGDGRDSLLYWTRPDPEGPWTWQLRRSTGEALLPAEPTYPFTGGTALDRVMTDTQRGSPRRSKRDRLHA
jgi:hypothetical protein